MRDFTIDGYSLKDFGLKALENHSHPIFPPTRDQTATLPDVPGLEDFGSTMGAKPFNLPVGIDSQQDYGLLRYDIEQYLNLFVDEWGDPKEVELIFDYAPDRAYQVKYSGNMISPERVINMGRFNLPLRAAKPKSEAIVYSDEVNVDSETLTVESLYTVDHVGTDELSHITYPTTLQCYVEGYAVRPIIEINGSATDLTIECNGKSIILSSFSNSEWMINGQDYTVEQDGINKFDSKNISFLELLPGTNDVSVTGTDLDLDLYIKYRDIFK